MNCHCSLQRADTETREVYIDTSVCSVHGEGVERSDDSPFRLTRSGRRFHFLRPSSEEVCVEDIAHHLALTCRFGGAVRFFYSVAQHSVLVSRASGDDPRARLVGLLHDAAEAYLHDIHPALKETWPAYEKLTDLADQAIEDALGVPFSWVQTYGAGVKNADLRALAAEARDLMPAGWPVSGAEPLSVRLDDPAMCWTPEQGAGFFLAEHQKLRALI